MSKSSVSSRCGLDARQVFPPETASILSPTWGRSNKQAEVLPPENLGIKPGLTEPGAISRTKVRVVRVFTMDEDDL